MVEEPKIKTDYHIKDGPFIISGRKYSHFWRWQACMSCTNFAWKDSHASFPELIDLSLKDGQGSAKALEHVPLDSFSS